MGPNWDKRHEVPVYHFSSIEGSWIDPGHPSRIVITASGLPSDVLDIDSLFIPNDSDTLIVAFHGALVRNDVELPRFEWLGTLRERPENLLFVADTTLSLSDKLTLGWYIGTAEDDLTQKIARYIRHVQAVRGIKRTILLGSSGGGYAALALATLLEDSCAVAFSPQTNVFDFTQGHTDNLIKYVFPQYSNADELMKRWPERFSLIERYKVSPSPSRFIYFQNLGDIEHNLKHKRPFAESLGVRLPNGRTFDQAARFVAVNHGAGHVRPPTAEVPKLIVEASEMISRPIKPRLGSAGHAGNLLDFDFIEGPSQSFVRVKPESNSYYSLQPYPVPPEGPGLAYTDRGVPLRVIGGEAYDHPVLQAQFLLKLVNNYRLEPTGELRQLMNSVFERLVGQSVLSRGARYLPYRFSWHQGKLQPPWYSAMAQGQALGAIARLYEADPRPEYLEFAHSLFSSFLKLRDGTSPWIVDVDTEGYLWFEEYPYGDHGMGVMNGHLFAVWGVYDYWRVTDDNLALRLASAALMTTKKYLRHHRNRGWSSHYDLTEFLLIRNYHATHISQLETTYNLTADPFFVATADEYESDFPSYQRGGSVYCSPGEHTLVKADHHVVPTMVVESQRVVIDKAMAFQFSLRTKMESEGGIWLLISSGEYAGLWIREEPDRVFPKGRFDQHVYTRPRKALFRTGEYIAHKFNEFGSAVEPLSLQISEPSIEIVTVKALWRGRWYWKIGSGTFRERWMRCDTEGMYVH
ncbi:D-glucuronyl C5-epimerase family protein [Arthrobacter sp. zg-Y1143]|uniref:D-glucuronyl C5-epimerase family protein n=1 Tax=Arthrobacter sp. zg-Y1143 TaxID=3049065 RepID=UPI0024C416D7|nr:D-glucuronyl C5-epimerase family protein [Arthrobacter sp. zg-Y1143]MDK1329072.1 D-glucuronyl C5-epimerase family protein [Arthrobacter sp. zg-Y1143]